MLQKIGGGHKNYQPKIKGRGHKIQWLLIGGVIVFWVIPFQILVTPLLLFSALGKAESISTARHQKFDTYRWTDTTKCIISHFAVDNYINTEPIVKCCSSLSHFAVTFHCVLLSQISSSICFH